MQEIAPNMYRLEVPLPESPLVCIYDYLILGGSRNLLIDTAFNRDDCEAALLAQLAELGVSMDNTDIFLTHMHVDHCGLMDRLKRPGNRIYASEKDEKLIRYYADGQYWTWLDEGSRQMGIPGTKAIDPKSHVAYTQSPCGTAEISIVSPGQTLTVGNYAFEIVDMAGHSPGMLGLWEPSTGILFCADHILANISPNITAWDLDTDYLDLFLENLEKMKRYPVKKAYPAHRDPVKNVPRRVDELVEHHRQRAEEMYHVLKEQGHMNSYEVASAIRWNRQKKLQEFDPLQIWFACFEAMAHLQHLLFKGRLTSKEEDGVLYYTAL